MASQVKVGAGVPNTFFKKFYTGQCYYQYHLRPVSPLRGLTSGIRDPYSSNGIFVGSGGVRVCIIYTANKTEPSKPARLPRVVQQAGEAAQAYSIKGRRGAVTTAPCGQLSESLG